MWSKEQIDGMSKEEVISCFDKISMTATSLLINNPDNKWMRTTQEMANKAANSIEADMWTLEQAREGLWLMSSKIEQNAAYWALMQKTSAGEA